MTKISHISWGGYDKGFYCNEDSNSEILNPKRKAVSQCTKHRKHLTNMKNPSEIVKCLSLNDFIYL